MLVGNRIGVALTPCSLLNSQLREQLNNVRVIVSPYGADWATLVASSWMDNPTN